MVIRGGIAPKNRIKSMIFSCILQYMLFMKVDEDSCLANTWENAFIFYFP